MYAWRSVLPWPRHHIHRSSVVQWATRRGQTTAGHRRKVATAAQEDRLMARVRRSAVGVRLDATMVYSRICAHLVDTASYSQSFYKIPCHLTTVRVRSTKLPTSCTFFLTKRRLLTKKATRVMHEKFNFLCTSIEFLLFLSIMGE